MKRGPNFLDFVNVNVGGTAQSSSSNVDDALAGASAMGKFMPVMRMPWESTPLMRQVLCKERLPWLQPFKIPKTFPAVSSLYEKPRELVLMEKKIQIRSSCFNATIAHSDSDRNQVLLKWLEAALIVPAESRLGNQLMALEPDVDNAGKHLQIVADTLRKKSTRTLNVRVSSLLLYIRWHRDSFGDQPFLPFLEENIYSYMCSLRDKACSASRGTTFISTLSFVKQILGMTGVQECIESARVSGAALSMYLCKRPLKQAPPLHPVMLAILELATFCESDAYLRCMAGFCLMCIYGRMRVSDVSRLVNLSVVGKFPEASLMRVKTSRSREKQTTFLPSVIPTFGVLGIDWFAAFLANRKHLGLEDFPPLEGRGHERDFVVLPSEDTVPSEVLVKVSTSEVTAKLRIILGKFYDKATVCKLTSHSLKTTVLTYVSVYGIDYVHSELLGYHLTQHRSAINYQRDALSVPIRKMVEILEAVKDGTFVPLAARDEVFPSGGAKCVVDQVHEQIGYNFEEVLEMLLGFSPSLLVQGESRPELVKLWELLASNFNPPQFEPIPTTPTEVFLQSEDDAIQVPDLGSGESSEDERRSLSSCEDNADSCSSSEESALADLARDAYSVAPRKPARHAFSEIMFRHRRTKIVHMGHSMEASRTACGRSVGSTYEVYYGDMEKAWPLCLHCFGGATV